MRYNIYTFDFPKHGVNTNSKVTPCFDNYCNYAVDFINNHNLRNIILIGHSMGGGIAQCIYPRISDRVKKIILLDPLNPFAKMSTIDMIVGGVKMLFSKEKKEFMDKFITPENDKQLSKENLLKLLLNITNSDSLEKIKNGSYKINVPTLILFGQEDNVINHEKSKKFYDSAPFKHEFVLVPNSKHSPDLQNTGFFLKTITKFLND
ncbi:triacylglycerol lipase [Bacilli bacterium]|nr:triacylglycerol lipase [Bacilli bacterium]